jgi:hypothetical protein
MWKSRRLIILSVTVASVAMLVAGGAQAQLLEDLKVVSTPTAGLIGHGAYLFEGRIGPGNDLLFGMGVGFHDRLMVGMSFGLQNFIGKGDIEANNLPGFQLRVRVIEEGLAGPAFALGLDTQGEGRYDDEDDRYERKSLGAYGVLSRNFDARINIGIHGGINYSFENRDESSVDLFAGTSFTIVPGLTLLLDYDACLDDNDPDITTTRTKGRGYLDCGIRFDYGENLRMRLLFKDLLGNYIPESGVARSFEILYMNWF